MKKTAIFLLTTLFTVTLSAENRDWININDTWLFTRGNPKNAAAVEFDDSRWEVINVPHDWAINGPFDKEAPGNTGKLPWKGEGWYRKTFSLDKADEGKVVYFPGEAVVRTAGEPHSIRLTPDRKAVAANGEDLSFILVEAYDKDNNLCPLADNLIEFSIKGPGRIAGVGNGDQRSYEPFLAPYRKLFNGKAMLILRSRKNSPGEIEVIATSKKLRSGSIKIENR